MELKIEAKNLDIRKSWQEKIEEERNRLIRHYANFVLHLRVTIEATPGYKEGGHEIRLVASVPNDTVAVKRWGENVRSLLTESFDVLNKQLKEIVKKKQKHKSDKIASAIVNGQSSGTVRKIVPAESYGFIVTHDQLDVFFHANSLKDVALDDLTEGDNVLFSMEEGDKGLQATWVRLGAA
ncbi:HPF/RaiA family ribosome-associated protein [Desulfobulbus rhabdoformis]|uniref:HPF/RaiA family ribosome-associated protein n=1 Tax=Desulfobulbus rhabdoformis TaxID=34032 RepID=UPI0019634796|nr:HPF/RaiA family ribosome-associated protein [Desulfobulbus rhabdoformis]MBM9613348.1 HPF/RaiA family ribosome-associated protein [Desulfobulbus rhabdoformis]